MRFYKRGSGNENPGTATFSTKGLINAIKPLREECYWSEEAIKKAHIRKNKTEQKRKLEEERKLKKSKISYEKYKEFITNHKGTLVQIRTSEWNDLHQSTQTLLDESLRIYIVGDDDPNAISLP